MSRAIEILTPEHVGIRYELAGFGSRGVAAALDWMYQALFLAGLYGILRIFIATGIIPPYDTIALRQGSAFLGGSIALAFTVCMLSYYIAFETLWNGETPGKRKLGLRVIRDGGYPVDFRSVLIRNTVRLLDAMPGSYSIGLVAVMATPHYQRLGDLAAGTLVVRHREEDEEQTVGFGEAERFRLLDANVLTQMARLTRDEYTMVQQFLTRRGHLPVGLRAEFAHRLAEPLIIKFAYRPPALGMDDERWLEEVDLAYRTHAVGSVLSATAPAPAAPAPAPILPATPPPSAEPLDGRKW
jgi:uncharacterized RDD family membrane protein YckC